MKNGADWYNGEHYVDPTAYYALRNIERESEVVGGYKSLQSDSLDNGVGNRVRKCQNQTGNINRGKFCHL